MAERAEPARVLSAAGSHLYPGARGSVRGGGEACMVEFADGSVAFGRLAETPTGAAKPGPVLALDGYTTARGTVIPARRWGVEIAGDGDGGQFRITARLA